MLVLGLEAGMKRRTFIAGLGSAAAWPVTARAQRAPFPVIGSLFSGSREAFELLSPKFYVGLKDGGYIDGQNVTIEYRWADGQFDRLPTLAADLVNRKVAVILATGGEPAALAAKQATSTIPIVFGIGGDPVKIGLVASLNRPGGNATGISLLTPGLDRKRLELLRELLPKAARIGALVNPKNPLANTQVIEIEEAARIIDIPVTIVHAANSTELISAFATLHQQHAEGLVITQDPFFFDQRNQLAQLAERSRIPAVYGFAEYARIGGLLSYGSSPADAGTTLGRYVARILAGTAPADLPVWQAVKIELVLNIKAAKELGLTFPTPLLGRADEVIE
jgi:putative ABC transport system substrate-binding protein